MTKLSDLAATVGALLKERGETVAVAESSTGGLISAALLAVPGASAYFVGGAVVYTATSREDFLRINFDDHPGMRSASPEYAALLAKTARLNLGTTWGLSETGAAGPTGNRYGDAAGHTCVAVSGRDHESSTTHESGMTDRDTNMQQFAQWALTALETALRED